jgi:hypothetical protein
VRSTILPAEIIAFEIVEPVARRRLAARRRADFAILARHRSRLLRGEMS